MDGERRTNLLKAVKDAVEQFGFSIAGWDYTDNDWMTIMLSTKTKEVEPVKCKDCKHKYMKGMGFYCSQRTHALNPEGHCEVGERE